MVCIVCGLYVIIVPNLCFHSEESRCWKRSNSFYRISERWRHLSHYFINSLKPSLTMISSLLAIQCMIFILSCHGFLLSDMTTKQSVSRLNIHVRDSPQRQPRTSFLKLYLLPFWKRREAELNSNIFGREQNEKLTERNNDIDWPTFRNQSLSTFQNDFNELDQSSFANYPTSNNILKNPKIIPRLISLWFRSFIISRSQSIKGIKLHIPFTNNRDILLSGKFNKIHLTFQSISFAQLYISGGGHIMVKGLELHLMKLLFHMNNTSNIIKKPYIIYADLLFTQEDIINSKLIRNLIQLLVDTILERVLTTKKILSASIRKVTINDRRLTASGTAKLLSDNPLDVGLASLDFEVSTGAGMRDHGQTLYLRDMQVVLNPDSILRTAMPIITTSPIDIDLGEDCKIESLVIANKNIWIRAASIISPVQPFTVAESRTKALYHYNFAAFLSKLLRISGGVAVKWAVGMA